MKTNRRAFLKSSAAAGVGAVAAARAASAQTALRPMTDGIVPITLAERRTRIDKARRLMTENRIDAILIEGGSSMFYFTGVRWGLSERPFLAVIPAKGEPAWVTPGFEEQRARELITIGDDVRTWEEDESPYRSVAQMQRANDMTIAAYKAAFATLREGMTQGELRNDILAAYRALGAQGADVAVSFGKYTAFPHGSIEPQRLREGDIVQVDDGCSVDGYQSDITRTSVFGKPTKRQTDVWNLEKRAQAAAFAAAKPGVPCEAVDAAARNLITDAGFGPGYKVPGLPHRTGHGIGLDIHEWTNFVRGNKTPLAPGMCFSDEPMIAIYGEFGIRL